MGWGMDTKKKILVIAIIVATCAGAYWTWEMEPQREEEGEKAVPAQREYAGSTVSARMVEKVQFSITGGKLERLKQQDEFAERRLGELFKAETRKQQEVLVRRLQDHGKIMLHELRELKEGERKERPEGKISYRELAENLSPGEVDAALAGLQESVKQRGEALHRMLSGGELTGEARKEAGTILKNNHELREKIKNTRRLLPARGERDIEEEIKETPGDLEPPDPPVLPEEPGGEDKDPGEVPEPGMPEAPRIPNY